MLQHTRSHRSPSADSLLGPEFAQKLEESLLAADEARWKRVVLRWVRAALPILMLTAPIIGWRLTFFSPNGVHVAINALAWLTFLLNIGVHIDAALLAYLNMGAMPSIVGLLLFVMVTASLLGGPRSEP
jgi:hypothetical protein